MAVFYLHCIQDGQLVRIGFSDRGQLDRYRIHANIRGPWSVSVDYNKDCVSAEQKLPYREPSRRGSKIDRPIVPVLELWKEEA